uniref:Uncharacterized protein n=1 Tax=Arundo donax TaxID=35708 RepID=A0A0A9G4L8_ARUDO
MLRRLIWWIGSERGLSGM